MGVAWLVLESGTGPDLAAPGVRLAVRTRSSSPPPPLFPPFDRIHWLAHKASSSVDYVAEKSSCTFLACGAMQQNVEQMGPVDLSMESRKVSITLDFYDPEHNKALRLVNAEQSGPLATRLTVPPWM